MENDIIYYSLAAFVFGGLITFLVLQVKLQKIKMEAELLRQENDSLVDSRQDWEQLKEQSMQAAKAAMFEASSQMSSKLIEDHKRESESSKKDSDEATRKTTEHLQNEFKAVTERLAALQGQVVNQETKISTVWQSLSSPAGAGVHAEIGLENTLKSFGLESGRDYVTQFSVNYDENRLRPDVVVFLPDDNLVVIDAKSSKFFLELAAVSDGEDDSELMGKLKKTMNQHLKDLISKDYKTAVKNSAKCEPKIVFSVIYLPSEAAREKVLRADPEFRQKCFKQGLILADPSSIPFILNVATHEISRVRQESNHKTIMKEVGKLVSSMDVFVRHIEDVGGAIKKAADNYSKLSRSVNGRLLSRVRNMLDYGVEAEKDVKMPVRMKEFTVIDNSPSLIDEDEAFEVADVSTSEKKEA